MKGAIESVVAALNEGEVRYLVVGGVAVVLHGHLRTTLDLDLVIDLAPENLARAVAVFERLGFHARAPVPMRQLADPEARRSWAAEKQMVVFSLWHADQVGFEVDIFLEEPFDFASVYGRRLEIELDRTVVPVIACNDLLVMKQQADRPRDREDVAALQVLSGGGTEHAD